MALSEIEKLERRYAENPQGLTFAPLAEVHRKNGEIQRALDLLGPGLEIHPDYIPARIVLGRCHMDLGDVSAAEKAFTHVLNLDGENVIALKALADIGERLSRFDDAERWLQALLTVDRGNEGAREQLQRVEASRRETQGASSAEPAAPEHASPPAAAAESAFEAPVAEPAGGWMEPSTPPDSSSRLDEPVEPLAGLVGREGDSLGEQTGNNRGETGELRVEGAEFRVETSEDIVLQSAGGSEFQTPDAAHELYGPPDEPVPPPAPEDYRSRRRNPEPVGGEPHPAPPKRSLSVTQTGGRSVGQLFAEILSARPPAQAAPAQPPSGPSGGGAPTRPAADALSLSSVFGEETAETPPAVSTPGGGSGSVSFDDFFSAPSASPAARAPRAPDPKSDDLDQFHAWLQNLKR